MAGLLGAIGGCLVLVCGCPESPLTGNATGDDGSTADPSPFASITGRLSLQASKLSGAARLLAEDEPADDILAELVPGELVVRFAEGLTVFERAAILSRRGLREIEYSPSGVCRVLVEDGVTSEPRRSRRATLERAASLRGIDGVRRVGVNQRRQIAQTPDDTYYFVQWPFPLINLPEAWDLTTGSDDIIVAIVDTGIVSGHPDLQGRLVAGYDFIANAATARDGDGRDPDPEDPGDEWDGPGLSSFHGTHVAGTIGAATNNGLGVAGVTWRTKLMPLRALGLDGGTSFDVAEAIRYAAGLPNVSGTTPEKPARIINLSVASPIGTAPSATENDAIVAATQAGVLVIAAAGNDNSNRPVYPAASPEAVCVGAVDIQMARTSYSNYGPTLDLVAPGGSSSSDVNGDGFVDAILSVGASDGFAGSPYKYTFRSGTSMATPHVAGVAALALAVNPALGALDLRAILESTAHDLGDGGRDDLFGHGLIDAAAAVRAALASAGQAVSTDPILALSTTALDFRTDYNDFHVRVSNAGGGYLTVRSVTSETAGGSGWLHAEVSGSSENANVAELVVSVSRIGLAEGTYRGVVTVQADGGAGATIQVSMAVGPSSGVGETYYVVAIPAGALIPAGQDETTLSEGLVYALRDLPAGDYVIYAGTDRDNDGFICDPGDLCGAVGSSLLPAAIHLEPGEQLTSLDLIVSELTTDAAGRGQAVHLPRLR